jgi:hypothetical protein
MDDCSAYRSEINNEGIHLMEGQSNHSQSDGIDGFCGLACLQTRKEKCVYAVIVMM